MKIMVLEKALLFYFFFINLTATVKRTIVAFPFSILFITVSLYYILNLNFLNFELYCFLQSFSYNAPAISSPLKSPKTYVYGTEFLTFLITKTSSDQFGIYRLVQTFSYFDILTKSPILNLGSSSLISSLKSIYLFYINRHHFNCFMTY